MPKACIGVLTAALVISLTGPVHALKAVPAKWQHYLLSTYLTDYKKGEHLIISSIFTGHGKDASVRHSLEVKVTSWGKPFTETYESEDKKSKEVFTVTLVETDNPKEMKAEFEHSVYENGELKLRFSGVTILARLN